MKTSDYVVKVLFFDTAESLSVQGRHAHSLLYVPPARTANHKWCLIGGDKPKLKRFYLSAEQMKSPHSLLLLWLSSRVTHFASLLFLKYIPFCFAFPRHGAIRQTGSPTCVKLRSSSFFAQFSLPFTNFRMRPFLVEIFWKTSVGKIPSSALISLFCLSNGRRFK